MQELKKSLSFVSLSLVFLFVNAQGLFAEEGNLIEETPKSEKSKEPTEQVSPSESQEDHRASNEPVSNNGGEADRAEAPGDVWDGDAVINFLRTSPMVFNQPCIIFRDIWDAATIAAYDKRYEGELRRTGMREAHEVITNYLRDLATETDPGAVVNPEKEIQYTTLRGKTEVTPANLPQYYSAIFHHTLGMPFDGPIWLKGVHDEWADIGYHFLIAKKLPPIEQVEEMMLERERRAIEAIHAIGGKPHKADTLEEIILVRKLRKSTESGIAHRKKVWPYRQKVWEDAIAKAKDDPRNEGAVCGDEAQWYIFEGRPLKWQGAHVGSADFRVIEKEGYDFPWFQVWNAGYRDRKKGINIPPQPYLFDKKEERVPTHSKTGAPLEEGGKPRYYRINEPEGTHLMMVDENGDPIEISPGRTAVQIPIGDFLYQLVVNAKMYPTSEKYREIFDYKIFFDLTNMPSAVSPRRTAKMKELFSQLEHHQVLRSLDFNPKQIGISMTGSFSPINPRDPDTYGGYLERDPGIRKYPEKEAVLREAQLLEHLVRIFDVVHFANHRTRTGQNPKGGNCPGPAGDCRREGNTQRMVPKRDSEGNIVEDLRADMLRQLNPLTPK